MDNQAEGLQALERLFQIALRDTGQSRRVANFLLAWHNAEEKRRLGSGRFVECRSGNCGRYPFCPRTDSGTACLCRGTWPPFANGSRVGMARHGSPGE